MQVILAVATILECLSSAPRSVLEYNVVWKCSVEYVHPTRTFDSNYFDHVGLSYLVLATGHSSRRDVDTCWLRRVDLVLTQFLPK